MVGSIVLALSTTENFKMLQNEKNVNKIMKPSQRLENAAVTELSKISHNGIPLKKRNLKFEWEKFLYFLNKYKWKPH
jgi:hypothetical protein